MTVTTQASVQYLNLVYFGRPADPASLSAWPASGLSQEEIVLSFVGTAEYIANTITPNSTARAGDARTYNDTQLINTFYQRLVGRLATNTEVAGWSNALATGEVNYDYLGITILNAWLNLSSTLPDRQVLDAKFDSAQLYTGILYNDAASAAAYSTTAAITDGRAFNAGITTSTPATSAEAQTAVTQMIADSGAGSGTNFDLTFGSDTATATTFTGDVSIQGNFALNTLNNGDRLTGVGSDARLDVTLNTTGNIAINPAGLTNIATINADYTAIGGAAGTTTLGMQLATGVSTINSSNSNGAVTFNNLQGALTNIGLTNVANAHTYNFAAAAVAGATDALTVTASNATGAVTHGVTNGYETVSIVSNGSVNNAFNVGGNYATMNVSGARQLTTVNQSANLTTLNAASATGVVNFTTATVNNLTFTGGAANDIINLGATYTSADTINGGDGTSDRLVVNNAAAIAATTAQSNVTNIEVVALTDGTNGSIAVQNFGSANTLRYGAAQAGVTNLTYTSGTSGALDLQNFVSGGNALNVTASGTATTDALAVTAGSSAAGNTFGAAATFIGVENVNLTTQGGAISFAAGNFVLTDSAATETLNLLGNQNFTAARIDADAVNASGMTGTASFVNTSFGRATNFTGTGTADTVVGSTLGDILSGGAGNDLITNTLAGTAANDVLTGGAGFDTFTVRGDQTSGVAVAAQLLTATQIADFTRGATATTTDILRLSSTLGDYDRLAAVAAGFTTGIATAAAGATGVQTVAQNAVAAAVVAGTDMVKLTTGVAPAGTTQAAFNAAIGTATVTGMDANDAMFAMFYDTTNGAAIFGAVDLATAGANTAMGTGDEFTVIGSMTMSATDYAAFDNTNLAIL